MSVSDANDKILTLNNSFICYSYQSSNIFFIIVLSASHLENYCIDSSIFDIIEWIKYYSYADIRVNSIDNMIALFVINMSFHLTIMLNYDDFGNVVNNVY